MPVRKSSSASRISRVLGFLGRLERGELTIDRSVAVAAASQRRADDSDRGGEDEQGEQELHRASYARESSRPTRAEYARAQVSDSFRHIFDEALVDAHEQLLADPGDLAAKVRFVTLYHLVIESTLGLTSFKFVTDYPHDIGLLPAFVEGHSKIHHDETRHIGYCVWFLRETVRERPDMADAVRETLRELLPAVAESLKPPGDRDGSSPTRTRVAPTTRQNHWAVERPVRARGVSPVRVESGRAMTNVSFVLGKLVGGSARPPQ